MIEMVQHYGKWYVVVSESGRTRVYSLDSQED